MFKVLLLSCCVLGPLILVANYLRTTISIKQGQDAALDKNWHKPKSRKYRKSQQIWNFYVIWAILDIWVVIEPI